MTIVGVHITQESYCTIPTARYSVSLEYMDVNNGNIRIFFVKLPSA